MECAIQNFPDEYNIEDMNTLLETSIKLENVIDIKTLYISRMEKLAKYFTNHKEEENIGRTNPQSPHSTLIIIIFYILKYKKYDFRKIFLCYCLFKNNNHNYLLIKK